MQHAHFHPLNLRSATFLHNKPQGVQGTNVTCYSHAPVSNFSIMILGYFIAYFILILWFLFCHRITQTDVSCLLVTLFVLIIILKYRRIICFATTVILYTVTKNILFLQNKFDTWTLTLEKGSLIFILKKLLVPQRTFNICRIFLQILKSMKRFKASLWRTF